MSLPVLKKISEREFDEADHVYKIIAHKKSINFAYFELCKKRYYISWFSIDIIQPEFMILVEQNYLVVGVDLKIVALSIENGMILFSLGLFSLFKGFENTDALSFRIFCELEDIVINKDGFSISQIISHDLEF